MSAPQPTNPDAAFPSHDAASSFSFPKEEEKVLDYWREIDAVRIISSCESGVDVIEGN